MHSAILFFLGTLTASPGGYESGISEHNGRMTIFINGQPVAPLIYHLTGGSATRTWEVIPQRNLRNFADAGYRLFGTEVWMSQVWREDDSLDIDRIQRQLRAMIDVRPDAAILLRLHVDPPGWWLEQRPDDRASFALAPSTLAPEHVRKKRTAARVVSFASAAWKQHMAAKMRELLVALAALPEGASLFAIHVAGGEWGEWFYYNFEMEPDTGPAMTRHFHDWLRARYGSDGALRAAWRDDGVSLDTAAVPDVEERFRAEDVFRATEKIFRDPARDQQTIDYYRCHQELVAETPLYFCKVVKETWPRPIIVGIFHAYFFHLTHQAAGGHLEMGRVLASPYVDYVASPLSYEFDARFLGGTGHFRCLSESIRSHGKLWLNEMDHPTFLGDHFERPKPFSPSSVQDSISTMRRNTAHLYTLGQGMWWYDFGPPGLDGRGGWWDHPDLMQEARALRELAENLMKKPYKAAADVLLVYDTQCFYHLAPMYVGVYDPSAHWNRTETLSFEAANRTLADAYKSGAAVETVHLDDLPRLELERYRVIVFAFTPFLSDARRAFIKEKVIAPGRTVVWVYAPGYTDGKTLSTARIGDIVGMRIGKSSVNLPPQLLLREDSLAKGFPETRVDASIRDAWTIPTFQVVDPDAEVLGYYGGSREVALARKQVGETTVWYSALPLKNPLVLREIFRQGGAHIYNERNDALHAGGGVLWLHTETGGARMLKLRNGAQVSMDLPPWTTVILDADSGDYLLK
ncbi:MAG TPA: hypothetical protein HPP77_02215 [Candidatus Hydrogenedentes bacterium]|nr:hypothetical protein [Candidatus Hydrogenedentota bacterium]